MNVKLFWVFLFIFSTGSFGQVISPLAIIHDLLQWNVAAVPFAHEKTEWNFDPNLGMKRRVQYEKDNGEKGMDLIARLGLGAEYSGP